MLTKKVDEIVNLIDKAYSIAKEIGIRNLFYNERFLELMIAKKLGHKASINTQGCDAIDEYGNSIEYKTINLANKTAGSFQFHWLSKNKIEKYQKTKYIYFVVRDGVEIIKIYKLSSNKLLPELIAKAKEKGTYCDTETKIGAHKSYCLNTIIRKGAKLVYENK